MISLAAKQLWGRDLDGGYLMLFSMRLDETGTDGRSNVVTIGGAVAPVSQWDKLELKWSRKLAIKGLPAFHLKEFDERSKQFAGWSDIKCKQLETALAKIIYDTVSFRVAISIDSAAHSNIKTRMRSIKGFAPDSDYTLCLRYLMFATCEQLAKSDPACQLAVIVEDGPWAAGAAATYQKVAAMQGKWKPAKHAHRLAGFGSLPKGVMRSLEAADYIAGREHERLVAGRPAGPRANILSHLLSADDLESWYEGMMREKELRRAYGNRSKNDL